MARAEIKGSDQMLAFMSEVSRALAGPADYRVRLKRLARLLITRMAEWCAIDLVDEEGGIKTWVVAHRDEKKEKLAWVYKLKYPTQPGDDFGVANVLRTGKPELYPEFNKDRLTVSIRNRSQREAIVRLGVNSVMIVPLVTRGKTIGAITAARGRATERFTEQDLRLVEELAGIAAVLVENARLYNRLDKELKQVKKIEERVRQSETKFRSVFDNALDAVVIIDNKSYFVDANPAAEKLFALPKSKLVQLKLTNVVTVGDPREEVRRWSEFKQQGVMHGEYNIGSQDGKPRVAEYSATADFLPGYNLFMMRDITVRKAEEGRKDDFLGIVSHELKTPLATIKAYAQILNKRYEKWDKKKVKTYLGKINSNSDRLAKIVYDLLDITRIREGRLEFYDEVFCFDEFIDEVVDDVKTVLGKRKVIKQGNADVEVLADRVRLGQVMANLLRNAANYSPEGSDIIVKTERSRNTVRVSVQDFGIGINEADQEKIFGLFYRTGKAVTGNGKGMGVGLYISAEIIRQYGGKMWVVSEEGKGATFYFEISRRRGHLLTL